MIELTSAVSKIMEENITIQVQYLVYHLLVRLHMFDHVFLYFRLQGLSKLRFISLFLSEMFYTDLNKTWQMVERFKKKMFVFFENTFFFYTALL